MIETIFIFVDSFLEILCLLAIVSVVNINATLSRAKIIVCAGSLALLALVMDLNAIPFHAIFIMGANIALFLTLKRPAKTDVWNYIIDLLISIVILSMFQLIITAAAGLLQIDLVENKIVLACIMIVLIMFLRWLSSKIFIYIFLEKYYLPYRIPIIFAIISVLFLIVILANVIHSNVSLFTSRDAEQIYLMLMGYLAVNLFFAVSMYREKRASDKNSSVMQYSEYLQGLLTKQWASDHDARHHLQIMMNLNATSDGKVMNKELDAYLKTLANLGDRSDDNSIIKDDVLISALLSQKRAYAKQKKNRFYCKYHVSAIRLCQLHASWGVVRYTKQPD